MNAGAFVGLPTTVTDPIQNQFNTQTIFIVGNPKSTLKSSSNWLEHLYPVFYTKPTKPKALAKTLKTESLTSWQKTIKKRFVKSLRKG